VAIIGPVAGMCPVTRVFVAREESGLSVGQGRQRKCKIERRLQVARTEVLLAEGVGPEKLA
jgi:hypothetical protein